MDLGTLISGPGGDVVVELRSPEGFFPVGAKWFTHQKDIRVHENGLFGGQNSVRIDNLQPGEVLLTVRGDNFMTVEHPVQILSEGETAAEIEVVPAWKVPYRVDWKAADAPDRIEVQFLRANDLVSAKDVTFKNEEKTRQPINWTAKLPTGHYIWSVVVPGQPEWRVPFEVGKQGLAKDVELLWSLSGTR